MHELIVTADGSHSILVPEQQITFHSRHGALQESHHVYIENGLCRLSDQKVIRILEVGFGTGLNAYLSLVTARRHDIGIIYEAVEKFPLDFDIALQLNYPQLEGWTDEPAAFTRLHASSWNELQVITPYFELLKHTGDVRHLSLHGPFDLVYFDAFDPVTQPDLWTSEIFERIAGCVSKGGLLLTYCSRTYVRRAMEAAGWKVEKLPGPRGKREIVRATIGS